MRRVRRRGRSPAAQKLMGAGLAVGGGYLVVHGFPLWIWPVGMGLWLLWAGLGPLLAGGVLVIWGWRLMAHSR